MLRCYWSYGWLVEVRSKLLAPQKRNDVSPFWYMTLVLYICQQTREYLCEQTFAYQWQQPVCTHIDKPVESTPTNLCIHAISFDLLDTEPHKVRMWHRRHLVSPDESVMMTRPQQYLTTSLVTRYVALMKKDNRDSFNFSDNAV